MGALGPWDPGRKLVVGVSGGADSMALALLLSRWGQPLACIVDHGLRAEAAGEAARTAERLRGLGVPARVVQAGLAPGPGAAERARTARYRLLLEACRHAGCADLALAHHADDQAETVRMRAESGSGPLGLAGMAAIAYRDSARLLRPLLAVPAARLRATLRYAGLSWEEDPSNRDLRTHRARLRATASDDVISAALAGASAYGRARHDRETTVAAELADVLLFPQGFAVAPERLGADALSALVWMLSGQPYPPGQLAGMGARTAHGVLIRPAGRLGPGWLLAREPAAAAAPVPAAPGAVWDRRFRLRGTVPAGLKLGALGDEAARFRRQSALPAIVLRTLPALRRGSELVSVPYLAFPDAESCRSLTIWFCPARPAAGAPFIPVVVNPAVGVGDA